MLPHTRRWKGGGNLLTVQWSAGEPPSPKDPSIRWSYLVERVLSRWDWTGRVAVLAFVLTTCVTATIWVLFGALGAASAGTAVAVVAGSLASPGRRTRAE